MTRPRPTLPNPNVGISTGVGIGWASAWWIVAVPLLLVVLVAGPMLAWTIHIFGPLLTALAAGYLGFWPPEYR